jgi:signal transduction histidine kinase
MIVTAHEMRTPLTLLRGYLEAILEGTLGAVTAAQRGALEVCGRTTERMIASFKDILEMLQIGSGRVALRPRPLDLRTVATLVLDEFQPFLQRRKQTAAVLVDGEIPVVEADPDKLRLVLGSLVQNAIKFSPDGGAIRVRVRGVEGGVEVAVEDDGIGLDPAEVERVFEEFYTGQDPLHHSSGTWQFEARGAGLGLAIARGHVEAHGGRIRAESGGLGRGCRFVFEIPLRTRATSPGPTPVGV